MFIKYCVFSFAFLNSASSGAALEFYLPGVCTHTDTEGKQGKVKVWNIFKNSEKTQYLMNTLYLPFTNWNIVHLEEAIKTIIKGEGISSAF